MCNGPMSFASLRRRRTRKSARRAAKSASRAATPTTMPTMAPVAMDAPEVDGEAELAADVATFADVAGAPAGAIGHVFGP